MREALDGRTDQVLNTVRGWSGAGGRLPRGGNTETVTARVRQLAVDLLLPPYVE